MPYPRRLLNEGEVVAVDLKPHWWYFAKEMISAAVFVVVLIVVAQLFSDDAEKYLLWIWGIGVLVWLAITIKRFTDWQYTYFVVTNRRVIFRTGMIAKRGTEIPLARIANINFRQGVWERIIGAGDLAIESAGRDGQSTFENVRHPDGVQQEIYRQMESVGTAVVSDDAVAPAILADDEVAPAAHSVPDQIARLAELRDQGVLTPEEFEAKKTELLGRM